MFSSNQILKTSGPLTCKSVRIALNFALYMSYGKKLAKKKLQNVCCELWKQVTADGKYYIGWCPMNNDGTPEHREGWEVYPAGTTLKDICKDIYSVIAQAEVEEGIFDGSYKTGFLMEAVPECVDRDSLLKNPQYGIVSFAPYTNFYSK